MNENVKKFLSISIWITIIILFIRCAISWEEIKGNVDTGEIGKLVYGLFGFIGEAIAIAAILMSVFNKWAWKWKVFKFLHDIPVLKTDYEGKLKSDYDGKERDMELSISQTFLNIIVTISTGESQSGSISAQILEVHGIKYLIYTYLNNPRATLRNRSPIHYGTAMLNVTKPENLNGNYFTDRNTTGEIDVYSH